jgi:hypothetical protein
MVAIQLFRLIPSSFKQRFNWEKLGLRGWLRIVSRGVGTLWFLFFWFYFQKFFCFLGSQVERRWSKFGSIDKASTRVQILVKIETKTITVWKSEMVGCNRLEKSTHRWMIQLDNLILILLTDVALLSPSPCSRESRVDHRHSIVLVLFFPILCNY